MSYFVKISGWSGNNQDNAAHQFSKVFRLNKDDAEQAMGQISNGLPWQFGSTVSNAQSKHAKHYLGKLGFDVELILASEKDDFDSFAKDPSPPGFSEPEYSEPDDTEPDTFSINVTEPESTEPDETELETFELDVTEPESIEPEETEPDLTIDTEPQDFTEDQESPVFSENDEVADIPETPQSESKPETKSSKTGLLLFLLVILGAVGLSQTPLGKDLVDKAVTQSKQFLNGYSSEPENNPDTTSPAPAQPTTTNLPTSMPNIQPLQGVVFTGESNMEYPVTLGGCKDNEDEHNLLLLKTDLEQTQKDFFCKDITIANPTSDWKCEFTADSKVCPDKESYSCVRHYQCIPEAPEFNKGMFTSEIEKVENVENQMKTGLSNLTVFRGAKVDPSKTDVTTTSISDCYSGEVLREKLRRADLKQTQDLKFCKGGTIANPVGGWQCDLGQTVCGNQNDKYFKCNRSYQCIPETEIYHRDMFQDELKKLS
jgi:hypothetical protein